ncbi:MAG: phosphodiester glycosidase family protein [Limisphaerales bacterium]
MKSAERTHPRNLPSRHRPRPGWLATLIAGLAVLGFATPSRGTMELGPWTPLFKGVDHASGANIPGGGFPNQHVVQIVRVDLHDPDVRLFTSPRIENHIPNVQETEGYTVSDFLARHDLQLAVNASLFDPSTYYLPAGTPMDVHGFSVSEGVVVSEQSSQSESATLAFDVANVPTVIHTNWPPVASAGIHTAITGSYPLVVGGVNVGYNYQPTSDRIHRTNPRTAFGISGDRRYLYIVVIDGRQPGASTGAYDYETGAWFLLVGATDAINVDGGGSTTLVVENSLGQPLRLNQSSAVADSGRERTVGSHFGIYAAPVPGFINDLVAHPDDITAVISWTTTGPSTTQVRYGTTPDLAMLTPEDPTLASEHSVALIDLKPGTTYFFAAVSRDADGVEHVSSIRALVTTQRVDPVALLDLTHSWKYTTANLEGVPWTTPGFDDSGWEGEGPGLLWVDTRGGPRDGVEPANTAMASDPDTGFPYPTYAFRTHFEFTANPDGVSLIFTNRLDDGAVLYLNGTEIGRLRMAEAPEPIGYETLAIGFGCEGDATCPEVLVVPNDPPLPLVTGDNVLAVEVHNYNARSPDITFGLSLTALVPDIPRPTLGIRASGAGVVLEWPGGGFVLQQAPAAVGPWTDVPGPVVQGPYQAPAGAASLYFRLRR